MNQEAIDAYNLKLKEEAERKQELDTTAEVGDKVKGAIEFQTAKLIANDRTSVRKVDIQNSLATPQDIAKVVDSLNSLAQVLKPESVEFQPVIEALSALGEKLDAIPKELPEMPEAPESVKVNNLQEFEKYLKPLVDEIKALELKPVFDPKIEVKPADVKVTNEKTDLKPLLTAVEGLQKAFDGLAKKEHPETDLTPVINATKATTKAINSLSFPVPNYILPFTKDGKATQVTLNSDGTLPTSGASAYKTKVDKVTTTNVVYIGQAAIGTATSSAAWKLTKIDKTVTDVVTITYADGGAFTAVYDDRASEIYT